MALTNAEKQAAWRDRQAAYLKDLEKQLRNRRGDLSDDEAFQKEIEQCLDALWAEGKKNMATASPAAVAKYACQLERLLVDHGIVPGSKKRWTEKNWRDRLHPPR